MSKSSNEYNIYPLPGFVVTKPFKEEIVSDFYIPDNMNDKDSAGIVIAVGDDYTYYTGSHAVQVKCPVKVGDIIVYQNIGTNQYLNLKTNERLHHVRFHPEPFYNQILSIIKQ